MTGRPVSDPPQVVASWTCVTGHSVADLEAESAVVTLDSGAKIRLCRVHGTPLLRESLRAETPPDSTEE